LLMSKDLFSNQSQTYAKYRPGYPKELFEYILQFVKDRNFVWDCATGNGQAAKVLSEYFTKVEATDISEAQLGNAFQKENIHYQKASAGQTPFADNSFDLITVATAYHWLNWDGFYKEAIRVGRPDAVVAIWCYYTCRINDEKLNELYDHFYHNITKPYWDKERRYVDEKYETVIFNFEPLPSKEFKTELQWTKKQFIGYLSSWSAVQHYFKQHGKSPVELIEKDLDAIWQDEATKTVAFPLCLRIGRIRK
jgi:ubiquinone/menaquinone biosynthesis C-methylase UbiE